MLSNNAYSLNRYLQQVIPISEKVAPSEKIMSPDGVILDSDRLLLIYELKITGSGSGDPLAQAIDIFVKYNAKEHSETAALSDSSLPCFILTQDNTSLDLFAICRACASKNLPKIYVNHLASVYYPGAHLDGGAELCRFVQALINSLSTLKQYYQDRNSHSLRLGPSDTIQKYNLVEPGLCPLEKYLAVASKPDGTRSMIKIVCQYGVELHRFLAEQGWAPRILRYDPHTYFKHYIVEMELLEDKITLLEFLKRYPVTPESENSSHQSKHEKVFASLTNIVNTMHAHGYIHGDLREENIMVDEDDLSVFLIDFDWSGKEGIARYPLQLNPQIKWEPSVKPNGLILKSHDLHLLRLLQAGQSTDATIMDTD